MLSTEAMEGRDLMAYQAVFQRYELKYLITQKEKETILRAMEPYMELDRYGRTTIRNVYFDTERFLLIRRSIEKPIYKEKLRIRSYERAEHGKAVFVELKKKYASVVYKRRISLPEESAVAWVTGERHCDVDTQITREIDYVLSFYGDLAPKVFLSYEREAYYCRDGGDFRVTFDENILFREEALSLCADVWGRPLLAEGMTLMEIKCSGGIPLWMVRVLSAEHIYKTSFSKYGKAYETELFERGRLISESEPHALPEEREAGNDIFNKNKGGFLHV